MLFGVFPLLLVLLMELHEGSSKIKDPIRESRKQRASEEIRRGVRCAAKPQKAKPGTRSKNASRELVR